VGVREVTERIGGAEALDQLAKPASAAVHRLIPAGPVKDALSGTWLGHPLHPVLTDVAIGAFTSAVVLDCVGGKRNQPAVKALLRLGIFASLPTAASGAADWSETIGEERRTGVVHALANVAALGFFTASLVSRRGGRRAAGRLLGLAGASALGFSGHLGGHLSFVKGVGVNHAFLEQGPDEWTPVLESAALEDSTPVRTHADGASVLLYRHGGRISALGSRCTHAGGPLEDGDFDGEARCVRCPWHGSVFSLDDGSVVHGPASVPQPAYDAEEVTGGGKVSVRRRRA
jgi:nitrite reductase/ring-hydroxylating ferredoxin subunit/uncharacterized membrane protein